MRILCKGGIDLKMRAGLSDFICVHEEFVSPEYTLLSDNCVLYFIEADMAVFAECAEGLHIKYFQILS